MDWTRNNKGQFSKLKRWTDLVAVLEKDYKDMSQGKTNLADLLPLPAPTPTLLLPTQDDDHQKTQITKNQKRAPIIMRISIPNKGNFFIKVVHSDPPTTLPRMGGTPSANLFINKKNKGKYSISAAVPPLDIPMKVTNHKKKGKEPTMGFDQWVPTLPTGEKKTNLGILGRRGFDQFKIKNKGKKPLMPKKVDLPEPPPIMPSNMSTTINVEIRGRAIQYINRKEVTASDCNPTQSRLYLPKGKEMAEVLTKCETQYLQEKIGEKCTHEIPVMVVDPQGRQWDMKLRFWPAVKRYVLVGNWVKFVKKHQLQPKLHTLEIWSFRRDEDNKLCFALNIRTNDSTGASTSGAGMSSN